MLMAVTVAGDTSRAAPVMIEGEMALERSIRKFEQKDYTKIPALHGALGIVMTEADRMCRQSAPQDKNTLSWFAENDDVSTGINRAANRILGYSITEMDTPAERIRQELRHNK